MDVLTTPDEMRAWTAARRADRRRVGLVPTMGALHAGHHAITQLAGEHVDDVVVSIFVNPIQFDRPDDFAHYPRPIDDDVAGCAEAGAAAVYAPTAAAMYPPGFQSHVDPGRLAEVMEGAMRPGHFRGVTTVVAKLFGAVDPHLAVFGEKDYQQLRVLRQMVVDLDMGIEILPAPIVREPDGLAMSSRNRRLSSEDRTAAVCVCRALDAAADAAAAGQHDIAALEAIAADVIRAERRARSEYITIFDPDTLELRHDLATPARIAAAVWFGDVRLIDNRAIIA